MGVFSQYVAGLNRSLAAAFALLERPRAARRAVAALLVVHTALLTYSAYVHSPTLNEPGHLVAGLSHWEFGRFELYRNNPPLVRMAAALPVMAVGYKEDWSGFYDGPGAMPQFAMGEDFLAANGERSFFLFMIARWACIPFSWIGAIVCYLWARDLYCRPAGVLACGIWCFEPNILAHASLITPDAPAAALGLAACYTFWRWLKRPSWSQAMLTGVVLGLAELAKTTLILLYPMWPLMWVAYRLLERMQMAMSQWLREAAMLAVRMAIGLYVLNLGYGFEGSLTPLGEFHFVSDSLTGKERDANAETHGVDAESASRSNASSSNRFSDSWLAMLPLPLPANYVVGMDSQQRDFEHWGRSSYLRGEWRDGGWWYYYLYAAAVKVPLGLLALGTFALVAQAHIVRRSEFGKRAFGERGQNPWSRDRASSSRRHDAHFPTGCDLRPTALRDLFVLLIPPLVIFVVVSSKMGINEHLRYVLPSFPFIFIGTSGIFTYFVDTGEKRPIKCRNAERPTLGRAACPLLLTLLLWSIVSSCWLFPHSLSYFNESIGGPLRADRHLLGSNLYWGQDLRYVISWHASCRKRALLFLSEYNDVLISAIGAHSSLPFSFYASSTPFGSHQLQSGVHVVSANCARRCLIRSPGSRSAARSQMEELVCGSVPIVYSLRAFDVPESHIHWPRADEVKAPKYHNE